MRSRIQPMTEALQHRGPDDDGIWVDAGIALGHRRLAILDTSYAGAQPMLSACGRYAIAFNGEIYNHRDLRQDLADAGSAPEWHGHSDTETLLAGIATWGVDATLKRAMGMFAFAVWDRSLRRLSLARDRMGEKPLYWGWVGATLVFGSELKALRKHPGFPSDVCKAALAKYLQFGYVPAPHSIHPGVYKLEPGCILDVSDIAPSTAPHEPLRPGDAVGSLSIRRYWSLDEQIDTASTSQIGDNPAAIGTLEQTLTAAVRRQMVADVPVGAFLSGGIDSSLIAALMQKTSSRPVQTFTIGFEDAAFNEAPNALAVARHLGTDHTEIIVTEKEAQDVIPNLPDIYDEPFADSSQIPTYLVCRAARSQVKVALSGDAGDELFGGYNRYVWGPRIWRRLNWMPSSVRRSFGKVIGAVPVSAWDKVGALTGGTFSRSGEKAHRLARSLHDVQNMDDLYVSLVSAWPGRQMVNGLEHVPSTRLDDALPACLRDDPVGRMMAMDMRSYLPDDILCKVDRAAMAVSLETRMPFLDPAVLAIAARLPARMKIRDGQGKWALRQVLYKHVPRALIERPKTGFSIPVGEWLRGPLRDWAEDLLSPAALAVDDLIDPIPIREAWAEHLTGRHDWTNCSATIKVRIQRQSG